MKQALKAWHLATLSRCVKQNMVSDVYAYFTASQIRSTREVQFTVSESGSGHSGPIFKRIQATESISSRSVRWIISEHRAVQAPPEAPPPQPVQIISVPSNFPVPSAMVCKGDLTSSNNGRITRWQQDWIKRVQRFVWRPFVQSWEKTVSRSFLILKGNSRENYPCFLSSLWFPNGM